MSASMHKLDKFYRKALRDMAVKGQGHDANGNPQNFGSRAADRAMQAGYKVGEFSKRRYSK